MSDAAMRPQDQLPLTPAVFHILLALADGEKHGYGIMQEVATITDRAMRMGPGTLYGTIKRMLEARLIEESDERPDPASFGTITADMASDMEFPVEAVEGTVAIWVQVHGLTPGFHSFHVHSVGTCDPSGERAFSSAGGHMHADGQSHGQHVGDLPSLLVSESGVALLVLMTDRFTLEDLVDEDGSAVIIHAATDNFGNIPLDRYNPDPDEMTLNTGDAGGRAGCGVIEAAS